MHTGRSKIIARRASRYHPKPPQATQRPIRQREHSRGLAFLEWARSDPREGGGAALGFP